MKQVEGQMVMDRLEGSEIRRLLNFKGSSRLEVKDDLTEKVLEQKNQVLPGGMKFCFIESKKYIGDGGKWSEYKILYSIIKYKQDIEYLCYVLSVSSTLIKLLYGDIDMDYVSLEEFDCSRSNNYYILLNIRRDIEEEIKQNEIEEIFKEYE